MNYRGICHLSLWSSVLGRLTVWTVVTSGESFSLFGSHLCMKGEKREAKISASLFCFKAGLYFFKFTYEFLFFTFYLFIYLFYLLFDIEVQSITSVVMASGGRHRGSAIHTSYMCPFCPPPPSRPGCHVTLSSVLQAAAEGTL